MALVRSLTAAISTSGWRSSSAFVKLRPIRPKPLIPMRIGLRGLSRMRARLLFARLTKSPDQPHQRDDPAVDRGLADRRRTRAGPVRPAFRPDAPAAAAPPRAAPARDCAGRRRRPGRRSPRAARRRRSAARTTFAASVLTRRWMRFLVSLSARTSSRCSTAPCAPIAESTTHDRVESLEVDDRPALAQHRARLDALGANEPRRCARPPPALGGTNSRW